MGQAKKNRRTCPVLHRDIPIAECHEGQAGRIACARDCPHFPFAAHRYADVGEIIASAKENLFDRLALRPAWRDLLEPIRAGDASLAESHRYLRALLREPDRAGRNVLEEWSAEGWLGVRHDRRIVLRALAGLRLRLLEVVRVEDATSFFARDLLDPAAGLLEMRDSQFCASAPLFASVLTMVAPLPHYGMPWLLTRVVPRLPRRSPLDILRCLAGHVGFTGPDEALAAWIEAHLPTVDSLLGALVRSAPPTSSGEGAAADFLPEEAGLDLPADLRREAVEFFAEGGWPGLSEPWLGQPESEVLAWIDESQRWLDGRTPRAASTDPGRVPALRNLLQALVAEADFQRLQRRPFVDWTPVARALGQPDLAHTKPADWLPPHPGESREDDRLRCTWPRSLRVSSEAETPSKVMTEEELIHRLGQQASALPDVEAGLEAFDDAVSLIRAHEGGLDADETSHCTQAVLTLALVICPVGTPRFGMLPARLRRREADLRAALLAAGPDDCLRVLDEMSRQPVLARNAVALLVDTDNADLLRPENIPLAIALTVAVLDELECCVATWVSEQAGSA